MMGSGQEESVALRSGVNGACQWDFELDDAISVLLAPRANLLSNAFAQVGSGVAVGDHADFHDLVVLGWTPGQIRELSLARYAHRARAEHRHDQAGIDRRLLDRDRTEAVLQHARQPQVE